MTDYLPTGSLGLDLLLGGGWKPGTINEVWGEPGSGKTTLAEHTILESSARKALWVSMGTEVPHRPSLAMLAQPKNAEQAFVIMETCVLGDVSLIVVDSANGLVRQRELDGDPDYVPHPQREYKDELSRLKQYCKDRGAVVIFLSKPRDRDRQPVRGTGISEKAAARVSLKITMAHQDGSKLVNACVADKVKAFYVRPGTGIDWADELARLAQEYGLAERRGSWIDCNGWGYHGNRAFAEEIEDNTRLAVKLDSDIRAKAGI